MHHYRRQAHAAAWYDSPDDTPSNLPIPLKNPFGKRSPRSNTRNNNDLHLQESGITDGRAIRSSKIDARALRPIRTDSQDYRPTTPLDRARELGIDDNIPHSATTPAVDSAPDMRSEKLDIPRSDSPVDGADPVDNIERVEHKGGHDSTSGETALENAAATRSALGGNQQGTHQRKKGPLAKVAGLFQKKSEGTSKDSDDDPDDKNKPTKQFTFMSQVRATVLNSKINILLLASPVGIALYYAHVKPVVVFVVNFVAIVPLAAMLSYATEEIAYRTGETVGGLLNASFGNAVELIVSIIALVQGQTLIVQTSLIGSILSNLLLVMGMCFFFGGFNRVEQAFNITVAQTASSMLFLAVSSLILPTAFHAFSGVGAGDVSIKATSRATAVLLLFVYACYIFFQLKTHTEWYNTPSEKNATKEMRRAKKTGQKVKQLAQGLRKKSVFDGNVPDSPTDRRKSVSDGSVPDSPTDSKEIKKNEEPEPQLSLTTAILTLMGSTVLVALNAEYLVDSINAITCSGSGISKTFVGLILLPIVGNAAEHATAVTVAVKDKMDLAIGVAVGSSLQIALLVLPFTVVLGWIIGNENTSKMTLYFDGFQIAILFVAVLLVNYLIQDGKSHWLEGVLLQVLYVIIAVAAWFYPTKPGQSDCPPK